jgi:hypothetical protein
VASKIFRFSGNTKSVIDDVIPHPQEGRFAIVTDVGRGMRLTLWPRKTGAAGADGEVVWS